MKDRKIETLIAKEQNRQNTTIELIASENFVSEDILEAQGSILTNKYAEGYSGKRYYGGCKYIDEIETLAIERAKELFGCKFANVQPHSGSQANMAAYKALINHGDTILAAGLSSGAHLTHGSPVSFSGELYNIEHYELGEDERIDYDVVRARAIETKPQLIITGYSAYSREIDFEKFREIADEVGAKLLVDMAHIAGLVAAKIHQSPIPHAHVVTSTTHKTLRGPRGGLILTNDEDLAKKINFAIFPYSQGGPLEHVIAAKAVCFKEAATKEFVEYQENVCTNSHALSMGLEGYGFRIVSGGTDNHMFLIDTMESVGMTGKEAQELLEKIHITTNKNTIPNEQLSPFVTSGIRVGTAAMTTKGFTVWEFLELANIIAVVLKNPEDEMILTSARLHVERMMTSIKQIEVK